MATTIGRVEFIVGLDGNQLPAQARRLARQMEQAGERAGREFSDAFDSSFDQRLSTIGNRIATRLGERGRLAGNSFASDFEGVLQTRFRRMQQNLADILSDRDAFIDFARGFSTVGEAVEQLNDDLDRLRGQTYVNEDGQRRLVLTAQAARDFGVEIRRLGAEADDFLTKERELNAANEEFEVRWSRLTRLIGDSDAFGRAATQIGSTRETFERLSAEIEGVGDALGKSRVEIEEYVDRLDRTRESVDRTNARMAELAGGATRIERAFTRMGHAIRTPWRNLDNDVRLVLGLVIGAADQIAVLGSAAGGGLITLGAAAGQAVVGVTGLVSVITALNADLEDLPPSMRAVRQEASVFAKAFEDARNVVASGAFTEMDGSLTSLARTLRALSPELDQIGRATGRVFDDLADGLEEGTEGFEQLQIFLTNSADGIDRLADIAGTFGLAFLTAFNKAQPAVEDFYGWLERIADQFSGFAQSNDFDIWVRNTQNVFASLGELLDTVSRGLNDLVTPAAIVRTTELLDNLSEFTPALISILDVVGRLDPLGLLALALSEIGGALGPLLPELAELADVINDALIIAIPVLADGLGVVVGVVTPLVGAFGDLLDVMPDEAIVVLTGTVIGLAGAFAALRAAEALPGAVTALTNFATGATTATTASGKFASALRRGFGKAGAVGIAVVGITALFEGMEMLVDEITDIEDRTRNFVAQGRSLSSIFAELNTDAQGFGHSADGLDAALALLTERAATGTSVFTNLGLAFSGEVGSKALALAGTLAELDAPIAALAQQSLPAAQEQFAAYAAELGATDEEVLAMLNNMPAFKTALEESALAEGQLAAGADLVNLALGEQVGATTSATAQIRQMAEQNTLASDTVTNLAEKIRGFSEDVFGSRDAAREYEAAIDDLSGAIEENGTTLDITTEAGRRNEEAVDRLAQAVLDHSANTLEDTGSIEESNRVMALGRQELIKALEQFNITGQAAEDYADDLGLIPSDIATVVRLEGVEAAEAALGHLVRRRQAVIFAAVGGWTPGVDRPMASGGTLYGPTRILAGEAGPEAIVPLDRPLSQVDPSVRALSAFAQGLTPMASGGVVSRGRQVNVEAGAIVVQDSGDPRRTANEVLQRLAEDVVG